jgi:endo-alpha-1,4-polygalactosaminidase (GH114 family)
VWFLFIHLPVLLFKDGTGRIGTKDIPQAITISGASTTISQSTSASVSTASSAPTTGSGSYWKPSAGTNWQIQLTGAVTDTSPTSEIYDIDLFDNDATSISNLKAANKKVICYFSAGSYEDWRPDAASFQASDKGSAMDGWAGEWWLNTNSANVRTIMTARIEQAKTRGCDGVDPDNVDGYDNTNGVGLTEADAVDYLTFLADAAHSRGLSIGLKNAGGLVAKTLDIMEWQVNEQCVEYGECDLFQPFITAGKPVFHIEYPDGAPNVATNVKTKDCAPTGFSSVLKLLALDAWVDSCQ